MPSPFPGMDPYLESKRFWTGFHHLFISFIAENMNPLLPKGLLANPEERVYIEYPGTIVPDVNVARTSSYQPKDSTGGPAILQAQSRVHGVVTRKPEEHREPFLTIRTKDDFDRVITIIELLSPTNKDLSTSGRKEYLQKQRSVLERQTHLLEIDLLQSGAHTVAAPYEDLCDCGSWDYLVSLHRYTQPYEYEYWFNALNESLPTVFVPLTDDLPEFELDLQSIMTRAYDAGPYANGIDYSKEPPLRLSDEMTKYVESLLDQKGLRI
jgi:hypothetical protein